MKATTTAKFICLVYFDGRKLQALTDAQRKAFDASSFAYDQLLMKRGRYVVAEAFHGPKAARTVKVRGKKVAAKDGPFAKAREPLGGFILIRAKNMREAEKIAAGIPLARLGSVEVRPIYDFS
ncbi:MAG TPA: YciI family protein [Opitutaceae bacterium]|jgi:hypothetical protein